MKSITIYPIIQIEVLVPDDYEGVIEEEINLSADFNSTTFSIDGCKLGDCELCGYNDADGLLSDGFLT